MLDMSMGLTIFTLAFCIGLPLAMLVGNVIGMIVQAQHGAARSRADEANHLRSDINRLEDWIAQK